MKLLVQFDMHSDLLDVPEFVVEKRSFYRNKFLDWLYNPKVKHPYQVVMRDSSGKKYIGMCYNGEAFVYWLNKRILKDPAEKAVILAHPYMGDISEDLPLIFF